MADREFVEWKRTDVEAAFDKGVPVLRRTEARVIEIARNPEASRRDVARRHIDSRVGVPFPFGTPGGIQEFG